MRTASDSNGRTVWFQGEAGTLAPRQKEKKKVGNAGVCVCVRVDKFNFTFVSQAKGSATKKKKAAIKRENPVKEEVRTIRTRLLLLYYTFSP